MREISYRIGFGEGITWKDERGKEGGGRVKGLMDWKLDDRGG